jgi:hypothetical protein
LKFEAMKLKVALDGSDLPRALPMARPAAVCLPRPDAYPRSPPPSVRHSRRK